MKLAAITVLAILLMVHMQPARRLAAVAAEAAVSGGDLHQMQVQLAIDAASALVGLLVAITLAIYKPSGVARYGARRLRASGSDEASAPSGRMPKWVIVFIVAAIVSLIAVRTLSGAGHHHGLSRHSGVSVTANV